MARRRAAEPRMVMVNKHLIHDLGNRNCSEMVNLRREFSQGRERYTPVKAIQAIVYQIPGCRVCFGTEEAFRQLIRTI